MLVNTRFLRNVSVDISDGPLLRLLLGTESRIPQDVAALWTLSRVDVRRRGEKRGLVGLTRWGDISYGEKGAELTREGRGGRQTITFYSDLLDRLSRKACVAVIVHELAHAWLNEHVFPTSSEGREKEADDLARAWGFGRELDQLEEEAETV